MDLAAIQAALASLGPWGIAAGIGLTLAVQWLRNRKPAPAPVPTPAPDPNAPPTPAPAPSPSGRPILDALARLLPELLNAILAKKTPSVFGAVVPASEPDLSIDDVNKILAALKELAK